MSRHRSTLADLLGQDSAAPAPATPEMPKPLVSGALRAMGLQLHQMSADANEVRDLKSKIVAGDHVVDLDPNLIDPSFVVDRIPVDDDPQFEAFVASIAERGQQVPVLLRPHPERPGRYQIAYGHRRVKAALRLKIAVRAVVKALTDVELVVAQAKENLDRQDLSYVERSLLAQQLEEKQFDRSVIMSALGVERTELSRLLLVATTIPKDVIHAIGPAPKIGRPRWLQLADLTKDTAARKRALAAITDHDFRRADTNQRFGLIMTSLRQPESKPPSDKVDLKSTDGLILARVDETPRRMRLIVDNTEFRGWLLSRLPSLVSEFEQNQGT